MSNDHRESPNRSTDVQDMQEAHDPRYAPCLSHSLLTRASRYRFPSVDHSRTISRTIALRVWPGLSTLSLRMISLQRLWPDLGVEPRFASTATVLKDHTDSIILTLDLCRSLLLSSHDLPFCVDLHVLSFACTIA